MGAVGLLGLLVLFGERGDFSLRGHIDSLANPPASKQYQFQRPELEIGEFSYLVSISGQQTLSLTGKKLVVQKGKLGLFRFALWREVLIEDGVFVLTANNSGLASASGGGLSYSDNISTALAALLPGKMQLSFKCRPVSFTIRQPGTSGPASCILADAAELTAEELRFRGNVRLSTGAAGLKTDTLELYPAAARIEVKKKYTLTTEQGRKIAGSGLQGDVFLNSLTDLDKKN